MHANQLLSIWNSFVKALELHFGPSTYENHCQALFKCSQTGSLEEYLLNFERFCNRVTDLSPQSILDCFLSGLRREVQKEMVVLHPTSISQAIGLAKLLESKLSDRLFLARPSYQTSQATTKLIAQPSSSLLLVQPPQIP
ncbi:hypothetical protein Salat_1227600 [Sesamum alatum]|uniref:Retrotransposon gag domain-containing protein n=1 Tax=Sesamum alatum TaxID=300844 RepID=A0AAE2CP13_9LAMI|nr:hypothetical protein Salat_1227600 [Sesamum alatum]